MAPPSRIRLATWLTGSVLCAAGCLPKMEDDPRSPSSRIDAVRRSAAESDEGRIPELMLMLGSDDPAVRLFGIAGLRNLTGESLGYDPASPEYERRAAIQRWNEWYDARQMGGGSNALAPDPAPDGH